MAKKKQKEEPKHKRYEAICCYCGKRYESDTLDDVPDKCCGFKLVVNDHLRIMSRYKEELRDELYTYEWGNGKSHIGR